jgi:pilus assembly protein CpaF
VTEAISGVSEIEDDVRELVRRRGLDPMSAPAAVSRLVADVMADYDERSLSGGFAQLSDPDGEARRVFDAVAGFGPLQGYLDDPTVEEVWINEPGRVFVARRGVSECS